MAEISIWFYWILQLYTPDAKVDSSYEEKVQKDRHRREMKIIPECSVYCTHVSSAGDKISIAITLRGISDLFCHNDNMDLT